MMHLRVVSPSDRTERVVALLRESVGVTNVILLTGAGLEPRGDVVLADMARESANAVLDELAALGCTTDGSVALETVDTALSQAATRARRQAPGHGTDAVVWEEVSARVGDEATLSWTFIVFMVVSSLIAAVAIMLDSPVLLVGAMVVGPEFGPLAALCVAAATKRLRPARLSLLALVVGFPAAHVAAWCVTKLALAVDIVPQKFLSGHQPFTGFISHPDLFSVVVAACAGIAGMVSLTSAKVSALIGVVISVTTIPAAANIGVATAMSDYGDAGGAALQLILNLTTILLAGTATLVVQRMWNPGAARVRGGAAGVR